MHSFLDTLANRLVDFKGRATRREFWCFQVGLYAVIGFLILVSKFCGDWAFPLVGLSFLLLLPPTLSVTTRRLHDSGKSGGWQCVVLIPILGSIIFLVLMCLKGDPGPNRFGDSERLGISQKTSLQNTKEILLPLMRIGAFFLLVTLVPKLIFPTVDVNETTDVIGQVTGTEQNRGYYTHHLNRNGRVSYDFNCFQAMEPLPAGILPEHASIFKLGHFLRVGAEVVKRSSSPVIEVHREKETTRWQCLRGKK